METIEVLPGRPNLIKAGNRAVIINGSDDKGWMACLYVNARNGIDHADITNLSWHGRTSRGALKWAQKQLAV